MAGLLCPSLESIQLTLDIHQHSASQLASILRENCPKLHSIHYHGISSIRYGHDDPLAPDLAPLFKDSFSSPGLWHVTMKLPIGLDHRLVDALLFHSSTLEILELKFRKNIYSPERQLSRVVELLVHCENLKVVRLSDIKCSVQGLNELLTSPWRCCGLELLTIEGYRTSDSIHQSVQQQQQLYLVYSCAGQGWFLKPGLNALSFKEALADDYWKRRLFEHMYKISGIKHAKCVKMNKTEFFAQEQLSAKPEVPKGTKSKSMIENPLAKFFTAFKRGFQGR
ncbi:hypothetical protein BGZ65_002330 [Modicella reniformis]|uniref:Uncharacterized protein n=1 Tax=Modicella reniformis TaxID=1440133 RepID=A0A9P6M0G9_9FUNG|nr:hypothetical protein BGZ65_002330 [Modicella reniformis]